MCSALCNAQVDVQLPAFKQIHPCLNQSLIQCNWNGFALKTSFDNSWNTTFTVTDSNNDNNNNGSDNKIFDNIKPNNITIIII